MNYLIFTLDHYVYKSQKGMKVFREMEDVKVKREKPVKPVKIASCKHVVVGEPYRVEAKPSES